MKRYLMEFIGTFFLTVAISLTGNPIAIGFMLMAMVYLGGHVSGGHFNPAVSLAIFLEKRLSAHGLMMYWLAQVFGACLALVFFMALTSNMFVPEMVLGNSVVLACSIEALFTMIFAWMCLVMVVGQRYKATALQGVVIGLTLMAIAFIGGLFNPAVAFGSLICNVVKNGVMADGATVIVYVAGPLMGAVAASYLFNCFDSEK